MKTYFIEDIAGIVGGQFLQRASEGLVIEELVFDSRRVFSPSASLFFAIRAARRNGHQFIGELYHKGVRNFVISERIDLTGFPEGNFILVIDSLDALQALAIFHRNQFKIPVIGITGSNGKTVVKEWLYQLLQEDQVIIRSPKSYNSQIGVPVSVWGMNENHTLAIFEAGISQPGEMSQLAKIIQPTIGILTNIGEAHSEGFSSFNEKATEKMKLFSGCNILVYGKDTTGIFNPELSHVVSYKQNVASFYTWSRHLSAWLHIKSVYKSKTSSIIQGVKEGEQLSIEIPFTDDASVENAITCWCTLLVMGYPNEVIAERMFRLSPVNMRLELKKGINHCSIINDSYSADISSLEVALNFLDQQGSGAKKTVILSDFMQTSAPDKELYSQIVNSLRKHGVERLIGIGEKITKELVNWQTVGKSPIQVEIYRSTEDFISHFLSSHFREETILIKGARQFGLERIVQLLELKVHQTVLEINLNAVVHNLKQYQQYLDPGTRIMAMVKAFAYGSGGSEIAGALQFHGVDYLGVAYADEGVDLRNAGIHLPVMVLNTESNSFDTLVNYQLEPDIYSFELLRDFDQYLQQEGLRHYGIHLEIETGMNRLGFDKNQVKELCGYLKSTNSFKILSVFTHLVASEDEEEDSFTQEQFKTFLGTCSELENCLGSSFIKHISNSAAILRFPEMQMGMVRLGIGLYGVDSSSSGKANLQPVATLKSTIAQIKHVKKGETISYNRKGKVKKDSVIATVRLGYADGYSRNLGNGKGRMWVKGRLVPVIGTVCMDMTMLDVTDIEGVAEGDDVIIFGKELPIEQLAEWAGTIPYEIMTGISQRVKRVYFEE